MTDIYQSERGKRVLEIAPVEWEEDGWSAEIRYVRNTWLVYRRGVPSREITQHEAHALIQRALRESLKEKCWDFEVHEMHHGVTIRVYLNNEKTVEVTADSYNEALIEARLAVHEQGDSDG